MEKKRPGTHWEGSSVVLDLSEKTEICWHCQEWNPWSPSPYPSHSTDQAVGNIVNKTAVLTNQGSSEGFRQTQRKVCRNFDEVVLFVLAVSGGGRLKRKVLMRRLWSRRWNGRGLHLSVTSIRVIKLRIWWAGHVARFGEERNKFTIVVETPEGKRPLGRPRCRWKTYYNRMEGHKLDSFDSDRDNWQACVWSG